MSSIDSDDLDRMLGKKTSTSRDDPFGKVEYKPPPPRARNYREIRTPDGETIYRELSEQTINPYSLQQESHIIQISNRCQSCLSPITGEMLSLDLIRPCLRCHKLTCPRCRCNTNLDELKPQYKGQTLCQVCWEKHYNELLISCPNCGQPVKDSYDVKKCPDCEEATCPACGVPVPGGALICGQCFRNRENYRAASDAANELFKDLFGAAL
jgi:hypothetical protein